MTNILKITRLRRWERFADGQELARYIYDFSPRRQPEQTLEIKKMDVDFWDLMQDDLAPKRG